MFIQAAADDSEIHDLLDPKENIPQLLPVQLGDIIPPVILHILSPFWLTENPAQWINSTEHWSHVAFL